MFQRKNQNSIIMILLQQLKHRLLMSALIVAVKSQVHPQAINEVFRSNQIVPNIVEAAPPNPIQVVYPDGPVNFGNELTPYQVRDQPQVTWPCEHHKFYTLVMIDPDAPSRSFPIVSPVKHWLVGNIQGSKLETGEVIAEYLSAGPPKDTGFHRYIFLVFEQPGRVNFQEPKSAKNSREHRLKWSLDGFRRQYNLQVIHAGNFFNAQWDPYVDAKNKLGK